jgi:branched-chain amino acid transport system ATP-binding protein
MHTWLAEEFNRPQSHLVVEDLTAGYGVTPTIVGVSLIVGKGEVVSVLGPNGAGKSTLLKALLGLLKVTQGSVTLDQLDVTNFPAEMLVRKGVGYVPQNRDVFEALTVRENLNMGGYLLETELLKERIDEVMAIFPALTRLLKQSAGNLSGGERKMLAVGRVLMLRPTLMILDEPTANLSPELSTMLLEEHVKRLAVTGCSVLLVEQKAIAAMAVSDWTYVMVSGAIRLSGASASLRERSDFAQLYLGAEAGPSIHPIEEQAQ